MSTFTESKGTQVTNSAVQMEKTKVLTFGEKLVGINFNPSADSAVDKAKKLCAELVDLIHDTGLGESDFELKTVLYNHTLGEILNAQMNVVKLLTLKY